MTSPRDDPGDENEAAAEALTEAPDACDDLGGQGVAAPGFARLDGRLSAELGRAFTRPLAPGLHIVATPIGNLADMSIRALAALARADVVLCEDTRHTRTLLAHYGLNPHLMAYHEHNAEAVRPKVLEVLAEGRRVALVSDAGTPLVSDPGLKLVREVVGRGHQVTSLPGPSAVLTALTLAGLPTDTFLFAGFLPPRVSARRARLEELGAVPATLVFFEAGPRLQETLADMLAVLGDRAAAIARELTKLHEEILRGPLSELLVRTGEAPPRGEIVLLVGPGAEREVTDADIVCRLKVVLEAESLRDAARIVAEDLKVPRARVYDLALALRKAGR